MLRLAQVPLLGWNLGLVLISLASMPVPRCHNKDYGVTQTCSATSCWVTLSKGPKSLCRLETVLILSF